MPLLRPRANRACFGCTNNEIRNMVGPVVDSRIMEIKTVTGNGAPGIPRKADQSSSRGSHRGPHSFSSGVGAKRRDKLLSHISIDDLEDPVAIKRA